MLSAIGDMFYPIPNIKIKVKCPRMPGIDDSGDIFFIENLIENYFIRDFDFFIQSWSLEL